MFVHVVVWMFVLLIILYFRSSKLTFENVLTEQCVLFDQCLVAMQLLVQRISLL